MTDNRTDTPSIVERVRAVNVAAPVVGVHFLKDVVVFVLSEKELLAVQQRGGERRITVHSGAILASAGDGARVITGGDDGAVAVTAMAGEGAVIATDAKRRWIDHVALGPDGALAWSAGKQAFARTAKGDERVTEVASTVGGLAFAPKGFRLALSHYNGMTLWFPNAVDARPETLVWKGLHHEVTFSPDGRFLVTSMQEPMLHGWRLADGKHMRMSGYAGRVRSLAWTAGGGWLATGGSDQLILWPFQSKDGPMGKAPRLLAPHSSRLAMVACHPRQGVVAAGYADGLVLLVRIDNGAEILARRPGDAPVSALAFNGDGASLAFGTEDGEAGIVDLS